MRRSPVLGILAFYPLTALVLVTALPQEAFAVAGDAGFLSRFFAKWWFGLLVASILATAIIFSVHAYRRLALAAWRRLLWLVGFWLIGALAFPAYWWVEGHAT